jgi:hypothetical protein
MMFSAEEIQRKSEPIVIVTAAGFVQFRVQARLNDLSWWLPKQIVRTSWQRIPGELNGSPVFYNKMQRSYPPWIKLFVFRELALNNHCRELNLRKVKNCKSD